MSSNRPTDLRLEAPNPWATPTRTVLVAVQVPRDMMIEDGYGNPYLVDTCGDLARDTIIAHLGGFKPEKAA